MRTLTLLFLTISCAVAHDGPTTPGPQPPPLVIAQAPDSISTRTVRLRLTDAETGATLPGLIRVFNARGERIPLEGLLSRATALRERSIGAASYSHMNSWSVIPGDVSIPLPRGPLTIEAFSGLETAIERVSLKVSDDTEAIALPLNRLFDRATYGFATGNVHLHLQHMTPAEAQRYSTEVALADGYDVVFFSYLERAEADRNYTSNNFTPVDLARFHAASGVLFGWGEEYRHNFAGQEGYGHAMFLDLPELILPASFGADIMKRGNDDGMLRTGILQARAQDATVLWCHTARGHEDIPNWLSGLIDGQILFDQGSLGGYADTIYRYLNVGIKTPLATGTDWFFRDAAMTYVRGPADTAGWLEALRAGKSFVTNGPLLAFTVDDEDPGAELSRNSGDTVRIEAHATGRDNFGDLQLVVNGQMTHSAPSSPRDGHFEATLSTTVEVHGPLWLAARIPPFTADYDSPDTLPTAFNAYGKPLFAHTSPVYVHVDGEGVFDAATAEGLIKEMEDSMDTITELGNFTSDATRDATVGVYREAIATLQQRLAR